MPIQIIPESDQASGAFNGGEITENKPLGFPREGGTLRPYSSLFYWAHARAHVDSEIGLHPHRGFEILSFVLKGTIRHFDTKLNGWQELHAGDAQIIRAGSGIQHAEFMERDSEMFQIWFDPNLNETFAFEPSYSDYKTSVFPLTTTDGRSEKTYIGPKSPFELHTPGIDIREIGFRAGTHDLSLESDSVYSIYQMEGRSSLNGAPWQTRDFALIEGETEVRIEVEETARLFVLRSPGRVAYPTYSELMRHRLG